MASAASAAQDTDADASATESGKKSGGSRRMLLLAVPLLLAAALAGLWFTGILPGMLGLGHAKPEKTAADAVPIYVDLPVIVANLNNDSGQPSYVKLNARLEVSRQEDAARAHEVMPRIQDLFQTYLREMHPEELRGSAGIYRLRQELLSRANIAVAPAHINNILFTQLLIQ